MVDDSFSSSNADQTRIGAVQLSRGGWSTAKERCDRYPLDPCSTLDGSPFKVCNEPVSVNDSGFSTISGRGSSVRSGTPGSDSDEVVHQGLPTGSLPLMHRRRDNVTRCSHAKFDVTGYFRSPASGHLINIFSIFSAQYLRNHST